MLKYKKPDIFQKVYGYKNLFHRNYTAAIYIYLNIYGYKVFSSL